MGKLIIVSNRLPVTPVIKNNTIEWSVSSGGLVSALKGLKRDFEWIGYIEQHAEFDIAKELNKQYPQYHAISIEKTEYDDYYNGFANSILWPLFHYQYEKNILFDEKYWQAYKRVNEKFAQYISSVAGQDKEEEEALIWVHDYHLMLVPRLLSELNSRLKIGFFSHIPFPSSEIYRLLPVRVELLEGVLGASVIGFHTFSYARHFKSSCSRVLGCTSVESSPTGVMYNNKFSTVSVNPIGIDPEPFLRACKESKEVHELIHHYKEMYKNRTIVLGIDRLDYTKGLVLKLQAFEKYLQEDHQNKLVLIQVGVPTREQVTCYQQLSQQVNQLVGQINSKHGTLDYTPIVYINKSVDFVTLCALYSIAQVLLVTSIRDGMNLVCFEYVACQEAVSGNGVTIISEFAGASSSLCGALLINPFDVTSTVKTLKHALLMNEHEREARHNHNIHIVKRFTAEEWGKQFVTALSNSSTSTSSNSSITSGMKMLHALDSSNLKQSTVLVFDYDAIHYLMRIKRRKSIFMDNVDADHTTSNNKMEALIMNEIEKLSHSYTVYLISRRDLKHLQQLFEKMLIHEEEEETRTTNKTSTTTTGTTTGTTATTTSSTCSLPLSLGIVAEYGMFIKNPHEEEVIAHKSRDVIANHISCAVPIVEHFESRTPGSKMYRSECVLVFDYHLSDLEFGDFQANELKMHLENLFANEPIEITLNTPRLLIMKPQSQCKTSVINKICKSNDKFLFIGDDFTLDKSTSNTSSSTISMTSMKSQHLAQYYTTSALELLSFLQGLQ